MTVLLYRIFMFGLIVRHGKGMWNTIFLVTVDPARPHFEAIKFQEMIEATFKRMVTFSAGVPLAALAWYLSGLWFVAIIALLAAAFVTRIRFINEGVELRGQSAESYIRWRRGEDYDEVELANGSQLSRGSYDAKGLFPGKSPEEIAAMLKGWRPWAARICTGFGK